MKELQTIFERLTGPDKEDQTILVLHDGTAHVLAYREFPHNSGKREIQVRQYSVPLNEFKQLFETLPNDNNLGHIVLIIPTDASDDTWTAWQLLDTASKRTGFSFSSMLGRVPTEEALKTSLKSLPWTPVQ
jgi:hypothetical protein